jgi:hypothetical protein
MKRLAFLLPILLLITAGCKAQQPVTSYSVSLSWTAPAASGAWTGCPTTGTECSYDLSAATIASGANCPANTGTAYTLVLTTPANNATTATDSTPAPGTIKCYVVQTVLGTATSQPSAPSAAFTIPAVPLAPGVPTPSLKSAELVKPALPMPDPTLFYTANHPIPFSPSQPTATLIARR